jgi:prepilin-type processing-associated H-X9-DG protein
LEELRSDKEKTNFKFVKQKPTAKAGMKSSPGFTLTELLVVITITIVLAALSFTGVQSMRQSAQVTRCADNLRAWGIAIHGYAADNNGAVQWNGWASISHSARYYETYLGGDGISSSSSLKGKSVLATQFHRSCPGQEWDGTGNGPVGYAMTRPNPKIANSGSFNLGTASDPSQLLLMIDSSGLLNLNGPDDIATAVTPLVGGGSQRHGKTINALFGDGHVSGYRLGEISGIDSGKKAMRERWFTLR